jgi:hypothetical protein
MSSVSYMCIYRTYLHTEHAALKEMKTGSRAEIYLHMNTHSCIGKAYIHSIALARSPPTYVYTYQHINKHTYAADVCMHYITCHCAVDLREACRQIHTHMCI